VLIRAVAADLMHTIGGRGSRLDQILARHWPDESKARPVDLVLKAATAPATLTTSGWASQLASQAVADFVLNLGPVSAGAQLLKRGLSLNFSGSGAILVPTITAATSAAAFVTEAAPIPVEALAVSGPLLSPRKFATITTFSREIFQHSTPTIESLTRAVLSESVAASLDAALLDAAAGDATRPAGLRNGVSATTASAATPDSDAMYEDLSTLAGIVAPVAGSSPIIFIASPRQATAIKMRQPNFAFEVLSSSGLATGIVVAIASNCLASAIDPAPRIDSSFETAVHSEDTSPGAITLTGSTVSFPVRSLYQTDSIALRLRLEVAWLLRAAGGIAWTQSTLW
jgi:hypothetical protein